MLNHSKLYETLISLLLGAAMVTLSGCATHTVEGDKVRIVDKAEEDCKSLGAITASVTYWGLTSEFQTRLQNRVAKMGGNTLVQTCDASGFAYDCPNR